MHSGKILEIINPSKYRIESDCTTYKRCGGCNLRHIDYEETLNMKQNAVQSLINKYLKTKVIVKNTVAMGNPYNYRNKLQFPVGKDKENNVCVGVFANRTHEIIPIYDCKIQNEKSTKISKKIIDIIKKYNLSVYDENVKKGLVRHIVIKNGLNTNEYMLILVINGNKLPNEKEIVEDLTKKYNEIKSIIVNINKKDTNVILGDKNITIYGENCITDKLGDYSFKISPLSFYQVNPVQAEALYNYAIEESGITKDDIVFDLYCGIGTISIFLSKYVKKVYGVEIVDEAIKMANENAKLNNIKNTTFLAGDSELVFDDLIKNKKIIPDVIFVDPPRKGLDNTTIKNILDIKPKKVVYISCNPASLVRDLSKMEDIHKIKLIQPFDMFPFTSHVECVAVLNLK